MTDPAEHEHLEDADLAGLPDEPVEHVEHVEHDEHVEHVEEDGRRYPSTIGGAFYLLVLAAVGAALVLVFFDEWRLGIRVMGGSLLVAAVIRLVLRTRDAGMLAVRHKLLDVFVLVLLGGALLFLAGSIPDQPGGF